MTSDKIKMDNIINSGSDPKAKITGFTLKLDGITIDSGK